MYLQCSALHEVSNINFLLFCQNKLLKYQNTVLTLAKMAMHESQRGTLETFFW